MARRVQVWYLIFGFILVLLVGRLYYIQILCGEDLAVSAMLQQQIPVVQPYSRGAIYDRHMNKLTNTTYAYYYLIEKPRCTDAFKTLIGRIGGVEAGRKGENYLVYRVDHFQETINRILHEEYGAYGFCVNQRYGNTQTGAHLIGYLHKADGTGASGLEKLYEEFLGSIDAGICFVGDGIGKVNQGTGLLYRGDGKQQSSGLMTTLDGQLQTEVEALLSQNGFVGTVIIADTENGQILTMASWPTYNPNQVEQYLNHDGSELVNKAVQCAYDPGPVLDVVEALATQSHVQSVEMAERLGFGKTVWGNFPNEAAGNLETNLSMMKVTPIQVVQMLTILANKGENIQLSLVMHTAQGESIPCANLTPSTADKMEQLRVQIEKSPRIENGWAFGYGKDSPYAIVVYGENHQRGKLEQSKLMFQNVSELLP